MQSIARRLVIVIAILAAAPAFAGKIGFLDTERAIKSVKEGQRQMRILDDWSNRKADEVEALRDRTNEIAEQINAQRTIASEDVIHELEEKFLQAKREFEDARRALQRDYEAKQEELLSQVATRIRNLAGEYAETNGFDAIMMFESIPLVYVDDSVIITDAVIRLYDERFPVN